MPLTPGTRIGHYEIVSTLGAGGMGEVYRARDVRLQRDVALKVLPDDVASEPDRLSRFEREARTLAALNHPHIAQIHGIEDRAIIMELVDGDDLSQRLAGGPFPLDEALPIARQIADALDAAHSAGIVHRDLKPANIKIRADGTVKVLDFGLARAAGDGSDVRNSATFTSPAVTQAGVILGTAAYMSPEQARGKTVDKRSDIWAFGCVLYEILVGRPAFDGETVTDVLGVIVRSEPDWSALPPGTPIGVPRLLKRCLQKDVAKRLRDIGDVRAELDEIAAGAPAPALSPEPAARTGISPRRARARIVLLWAASLVAAVAAAGIAGYLLRPQPAARLQKLSIPVESNAYIIEPAISPDGTKIAFVAPARARIAVRALDQWAARELDGTEGAVRPFWSPDSQWLAFVRAEQLMKVPAVGGPVVRIATLPAVQVPLRVSNGVWTEDGFITVSLGTGPPLRVSAGGGSLTPVTTLPQDGSVRTIGVLPNGAWLLGLFRRDGQGAIAISRDGATRVIHEGFEVRRPAFAPPNHLIFSTAGARSTLWAAPFSLERLELTGEPFLIGEGSEPSVSRDGTLAFLPSEGMPRHLAWFSLDGQVGPRLAEPRDWIEGVAISRDGRRVLASTTDGIWSYDSETGARSRVTTGSSDITPQWVDANTIVYVRTEESVTVLVLKWLGAQGGEQVLARRARFPRVTGNGKRVVFNRQADTSPAWHVAWIDFDRPSEVQQLPALHDGARFPSVSPDGSLVAYISGEMGRDEVFLTRLPSGEGKWQLSTNGGGWTLFQPDGSAVIYRALDNALMSVPITRGDDVKVGLPRLLFQWGGAWAPFYDLAADGKRGVTALPLDAAVKSPSISIVQNWFLEFARQD
jgi:Tol biopolymer transport system component